MKTKLSFLALLISLGLALTFALAACSGGGGSGDGDSSSSNGDNVHFSSAAESEQIRKEGFDFIVTSSGIVELSGIFHAASADPILTLDFFPHGWVKFDGNVVNSPITSFSDNTYIMLRNYDAEVDLTNSSIDCGAREVKVSACAKKIGNNENCSEYIYKFEKPASYCATSSSGGGGARSSSSEATWKFGSKEGPISAADKAEKEIPGFSAKFTIKEQTVAGIDLVTISISGGNIRLTSVPYNAEDDKSGFTNGYPEPNKAYPNSIFKNMTSASQSMDIENLNEYYIITASSGSDRYLIRVEPKEGPAGSPGEWPKKVYYWKVLEGPNP